MRPLPHRKPPAHLDSTGTSLTAWLVKRLGKHTDKQSQPHLNQLISKSILLATRKTCAADDSLDTCRHPDTAVNVSQSFPSSETHINVLYYPAQSRVQAPFPFFSHIQLIPNVWQTCARRARPMWNFSGRVPQIFTSHQSGNRYSPVCHKSALPGVCSRVAGIQTCVRSGLKD